MPLHSTLALEMTDDNASSQLSRFAALIGLDWSDRKHDVCLQCATEHRREASVIEHSVEAIDSWAQGLRERFAGRCVAIALELEQGPIVCALRKYDFIVRPARHRTLQRTRAPTNDEYLIGIGQVIEVV